jgi:hypothetical protein
MQGASLLQVWMKREVGSERHLTELSSGGFGAELSPFYWLPALDG